MNLRELPIKVQSCMKIEIISKTVHYCTLRGIEKVIWKNPEERKKEISSQNFFFMAELLIPRTIR